MKAALTLLVGCAIIVAVTASIDLNLGTHSGHSDVILNGVVQPGYEKTHGGASQAENVWKVTFWMKSMEATGASHNISIAPRTAATVSVVVPIPKFDITGGGSPYAFDIQLICSGANTGESIAIDISADDLPPVTIYFDKNCTYPQINVGQDDQTAGIVHKSVVTKGWTYVARPDDQTSKFFVWMDVESPFNTQPFAIKDVEYDKTKLKIEYSTDPNPAIAPKLNVPGAVAPSINFTYTCVNDDPESDIAITLTLDLHWTFGVPDRDIKFTWHKKCSSTWVEHPRPGLDIGLTRDGDEVIRNGRTAHGWEFHQHLMGTNDNHITFWVSLNGSETTLLDDRKQAFRMTMETERDASGFTGYDIHARNTSGIAYADQGPVQVSLFIICRVESKSSTRVKVQLEGYDTISFYFEKACTWPKLQMGLSEGQHSEIIKDTVVQTAWNYVEQSERTKFFFWLPKGDAVQEQSFRVHAYHYDHRVLDHSRWYIDNSQIARPILLDTPEASIHIDYVCRPDAAGKSSNVNITVEIGWTQHLVVSWVKHCPAPSSSSGWSAFGIFAFTVFMLTLVGCLAGCIYNRFGQGKHGFEIVPCSGVMTNCYEKALGKKTYSPQTDYSYDAAEEKGTSGYQTDL